ncbi:MAG: hypothetical protein HY744_12935 [Deltaproteobacteria bacterium]|nr:hypothetical protein [Deltaproteobacteria bacterium]
MTRRAVLALLAVLLLCAVATPAWAGSYLDRASVLLDGARIERDMVRPRSSDQALVDLVYRLAQVRARTARQMSVPQSVAPAHPHLLLVLENCESAYAASLRGDRDKFVEHVQRARAEDATFRALIAQLGYRLPVTASDK